MATKAVDVTGTKIESTPSPSFTTLLVIAVVGCAAAVMLVVLAFTSDHLVDPGVRAALGMWISIPYIAAGLIAWSRRPDSRFGLLMIVAGFGTILSLLTWANSVVLYSIGQAFDFVPPVLLIHLILTFPTGRLERPLERWIVTAGYFLGVGLALIRLILGGVDPHLVPSRLRSRGGPRRRAHHPPGFERALCGRYRCPRSGDVNAAVPCGSGLLC